MLIRSTFLIVLYMTISSHRVCSGKEEITPPNFFDRFEKQCLETVKAIERQRDSTSDLDNVKDETLASPKEFPSTVLIGYGRTYVLLLWLCGGTLISPNYVLSAGHCAYHPKAGKPTKALLGELDASTDRDETVSRYMDILSVIVHPDYRHGSLKHDLALFRIENVDDSQYFNPACILRQTSFEGTWSPGWGININNPFFRSFHLKKGKVLMNNLSCASLSIPDDVNKDNLICLINEEINCQSDGGGGLFSRVTVDNSRLLNLLGVKSLGRCNDHVAVFTKIEPYLKWISSNIF